MHFSKAQLCVLLVIASLSSPMAHAVSSRDKAWSVLRSGVESDNTRRRAAAIGSLSLVPGDTQAVSLITAALDDPKPEVRAAAATSAGKLHIKSAIPKLKAMLADPEMTVMIAAAHALTAMKDADAYQAYYEILTGERKGKGLIAAQMATLRDPKKMALLGLSEGVGFVPFASIGWDAMRAIHTDDTSPIRAAAATLLADDPDPKSLEALETAAGDKSWLVRIAALEALAKRKEPGIVNKIELSMFDDRSEVRYTAAALVLHLGAIPRKKASH
jgi:HEAT repeat protein